jgi:hypothetical protein
VIVGFAAPAFAVQLKPLGDGFIKLITMLIPLIVFCVVVHGIAGAGDLKRVGRVGVKALLYFEVVTSVALGLGLLLAFVFHPGAGMNVDTHTLDPSALKTYAANASKLTGPGSSAPSSARSCSRSSHVAAAFAQHRQRAAEDHGEKQHLQHVAGRERAHDGARDQLHQEVHRAAPWRASWTTSPTCCSRPWAS